MKKLLIVCAMGSILAGCATAPTGPTVSALPGAEKPIEIFQQEDLECRNYAWQMMGGQQAVDSQNQKALAAGAVGTAIGAAAGALLGAGPHGAHGESVGAGAAMGLIAGSMVGAGNNGEDQNRLQLIYDNAYAACMSSKGNTVQMPDRSQYVGTGVATGTAVAPVGAAIVIDGGRRYHRPYPPRYHHRPGPRHHRY